MVELVLDQRGGAVTTDPYWYNVSLLLHGDGTDGAQNSTFVDSSPNNLPITRFGNTTQGTFSPFSKEEGKWSAEFDGASTTMIQTGVSSLLGLSTDNFTIEGWFNQRKKTTWYPRVFSAGATWGTSGAVYLTVDNNDRPNKASFGFFNQAENFLVSTTSISKGQWYHFAITRSGNTFRLFINGLLEATATSSAAVDNGSSYWTIGNAPTQKSSEAFDGYVSNLRFVKGTALYSSNFTPSTAPLTAVFGTSLLCCQDNRFKDNSANNFTLTPNGDVMVTPFSPFANSVEYSAGVNGRSGVATNTTANNLLISASNAFLYSGDFCIETYIYTNSVLGPICGTGGAGAPDQIYLNNSAIYYDGTNFLFPTTAASVVRNTWCHICVTRDAGVIRVFINGILIGTKTNNAPIGSNTLPFGVFTRRDKTDGLAGTVYLSGFRICNGSIPEDRKSGSTSVGTVAFAPPTAPLTAVTNTSLLLNFTNAGIIDDTGMNDLETVGNAQISTTVKKYGTGAISLPTSGYLINRDARIKLGNGDFTIEFWVKSASDEGGSPGLVSVDSALTGGFAGIVITKSGVFVTYTGTEWEIVNASLGTVNDNTWRHIAVVRNGNALNCFNNGILQSSTPITSAVFYKGPALIVGKKADNYVTGTSHIDDLRITKGFARYTANFTPPVEAFPNK